MQKKLVFDTLNYAKMLKAGGVECHDVHSQSLAEVITHNIYTKDEVDKMIDASLKRFDERTHEMKEEFAKEIHETKIEMQKIRREIVSELTRNISIMAILLTLVSSILHYIS